MALFLTFPHEKTTFQLSKVVSEATFPTNWGYICIEKWSQIFVSGTGRARTESEEKAILVVKEAFYNLSSFQRLSTLSPRDRTRIY